MQFFRAFDQPKPRAKLIVQRVCVITHDFQTAARLWTFRPEGTDNDVTSASYRTRHAANVGEPLLVGGQKMKYGPVMPNIVGMGLQFRGEDVGHKPMNVLGSFSHALFRDVDRGLRNIEYGDVLISAPRETRSSASVDSPPPTSMMEEERPAPVRSIRASDVSRCGRYQLTVSGAFVL
jgi:hypothetical protein